NFTIDAAVLAAAPVTLTPASSLLAYADAQELTTWAMALYNRFYTRNRQTRYVAAAAEYDSVIATRIYEPVVGPNEEVVSADSVLSPLASYAFGQLYQTSTADAQSQGVCASENVLNHSCLRHNTAIVDDLFAGFIATLTPPPPPPRLRAGGRSVTP